jgi:hypothetical protein
MRSGGTELQRNTTDVVGAHTPKMYVEEIGKCEVGTLLSAIRMTASAFMLGGTDVPLWECCDPMTPDGCVESTGKRD